METPEVLPAENEENDPKKTVSRPPKTAVEQEEDDEETPIKKDTAGDDDESGDDSDDEDDSEGDDSDDDDENPDDDDDDDDGETGSGTSSGEEDENELIWLKKEEKNIKNQFLKPENIKPKIPKKEKIKGPEKIDRTPWQQMIDFLVHGAKGAMIKNGDISIKEQIADKLLLGLGFKSFKEDILLQQQAKKYWTQKLSGQKADVSLLNTDKITKKIKNEETVQQNKQTRQEKASEHTNFLTRLIKQKNQESVSVKPNRQPENLNSRILNQKPEKQPVSHQTFVPQQTQTVLNETKTTVSHGLKEKIGQAVQPVRQTEQKLPVRQNQPVQQNEVLSQKPLTVAELKRQEKKEAELNPTVEQSIQKQQKQDQKDFHNMIMMQQMQLQNNMQNTMQSKLQNEIQQQALQQQMGFVAAARAGLQHFHHPHHRQPPELQLEPLNKQPITPEQGFSNSVNSEAINDAREVVRGMAAQQNALEGSSQPVPSDKDEGREEITDLAAQQQPKTHDGR